MKERLQKVLSQAGVASRRASEQLMVTGRVRVNGVTITELGTKADPSHDDIRVDGRRVSVVEEHRYLLLNKPKGYVSTRADPQRRPTVLDLLRGVREYIYPVGRLDYDSEGLLLLTNDGDLAARLTHPRHGVARVYEVRVLGTPDAHDLDRLSKGMMLEGRRTEPADVQLRTSGAAPVAKAPPRPRTSEAAGPAGKAKRERQESVMVITIREGRNRQVRKMCDAIGHPVSHLRRTAIGPIRDPKLKPGYWRDLTADEVARLQKAVSGDLPVRATRGRRAPRPPAAVTPARRRPRSDT